MGGRFRGRARRALSLRRRALRLARRRLLTLRRCDLAASRRLSRLDAASPFGTRPLLRGRSLALRLHPLLLPLALRLLFRALHAALRLRRFLPRAAIIATIMRLPSLLRRCLALLPFLLAPLLELLLRLLSDWRLRLLLPLLTPGLLLLPLGRRLLARGRRRVRGTLGRARRPVAETAALAGGERLRRLHPIGGAYDVLSRAYRRPSAEVRGVPDPAAGPAWHPR